MKKWIFYVTICCLILTKNVNAAIYAENKTVTQIEVLDHGGFIIWFDSEINSVCSANGTNSAYYYSGQHDVKPEGIKSLLSAALMALSTGMKVDIYYDDGSQYCWGRYIRLNK